MILSIPFPIINDELFTSWFGAVASETCRVTGMTEEKYMSVFFGQHMQRKSYFTRLYPMQLDKILEHAKGTELFPDAYEIIQKHTIIDAMSVGMSEQMKARLLEYVFRSDKIRFGPVIHETEFHMCPECRKEGLNLHHREVVHVLHQIPGVRVCYKHGCVLSGCEGDMDPEIERKVAVFAKYFYDHPFDGSIDDADRVLSVYRKEHNLSRRDMLRDAVKAGYLEDKSATYFDYSGRKDGIYSQIFRLLAYAFPDPEEFVDKAGEIDSQCRGTDKLELISDRHGIGEYRCRDCGTVFHRHRKAVEVGMLCPVCRNGMDEAEYQSYLLSKYQDSQYEYVSGCYGKIRHKPCGTTSRAHSDLLLRQGNGCPVCQRGLNGWKEFFEPRGYEVLSKSGSVLHLKHMVCGCEYDLNISGFNVRWYRETDNDFDNSSRSCPKCYANRNDGKRIAGQSCVGTYLESYTGIGCTIVEYVDYNHVRLKFDNGLERWTHYSVAMQIPEKKRSPWPELQIGRTGAMQDGMRCRIVEYEDYNHIVVEFDDGIRVQSNLEAFKTGRIKHS